MTYGISIYELAQVCYGLQQRRIQGAVWGNCFPQNVWDKWATFWSLAKLEQI